MAMQHERGWVALPVSVLARLAWRGAHALLVYFVLVSPVRAEYWLEYTDEWRAANARMIAEGVLPERIGPFATRAEAEAALAEIAGAHGVTDGIGWSSCMGDYLRVAGSEGSSAPVAGDDYDWAAYYAQQAEWQRQAEEARRRAEEEDRQRRREREEHFANTHAGALAQLQGRPWQGGEEGTTEVDLPPAALGTPAPSAAAPATPPRLGTGSTGNAVWKTVQVPVPVPDAGAWQRGARLPDDDAPVVRLWLSPQAAAVLGVIGRSIKDAPCKFGEMILGALGAEPYLTVIKVNKALADDALQSVDEALALMRRGYPEPETTQFLRNQEMRSLKIVVENISDIPMPEDEAELEADGRRWFRWLTRGRVQ